MQPGSTCRTCAHFHALGNECHARPPIGMMVATPQGPTALGYWPPTKPDNWCGEHKLDIAGMN